MFRTTFVLVTYIGKTMFHYNSVISKLAVSSPHDNKGEGYQDLKKQFNFKTSRALFEAVHCRAGDGGRN